jgi:hypothetical protein
MKTDRLIDALVADRAAFPRRPLGVSLATTLGLGLLASLVVFLATLGIRPDIRPALETWRFNLKVATMLLALLLSFGVCLAVSRPLVDGHPARRLLILLAVTVAAVAIELSSQPSAAWPARLVGSNALVCLMAIPAFALAPLAAILVALRAGAPASPTLAGAAAGLLAAASGASLYAFHCFDDSPLFVATWYSLAAIPVIALGALLGRRLLRW